MTLSLALPSIPWVDIKPNSLVVARLPEARLDDFVFALRANVDDSIKVVPMQPDTEVLVVDEDTLRRMGWVRKGAG